MKLHKPQIVWMWQAGIGVRYDAIRCFYGTIHCVSVFLPGVSVVFSGELSKRPSLDIPAKLRTMRRR